MNHEYTIKLFPYGPDNGIVEISPNTEYGYWEFKDGSEGGGLWFAENELIDYDGHYILPRSIVKSLRENGFILDSSFD